jgi:hypothetical protein
LKLAALRSLSEFCTTSSRWKMENFFVFRAWFISATKFPPKPLFGLTIHTWIWINYVDESLCLVTQKFCKKETTEKQLKHRTLRTQNMSNLQLQCETNIYRWCRYISIVDVWLLSRCICFAPQNHGRWQRKPPRVLDETRFIKYFWPVFIDQLWNSL